MKRFIILTVLLATLGFASSAMAGDYHHPPKPTYTVCYKGETIGGLNALEYIFYVVFKHAKPGECETPPPPTDLCANIDGVQETVPPGLVRDEQGNCVTPPPPPEDKGSATVWCDLPSQTYHVTGEINGKTVDSATPETIPGSYKGWTNVTLHSGDTDFRTAVWTYGDCVQSTPPPSLTTTPPPPPTTTTTPPPPTMKTVVKKKAAKRKAQTSKKKVVAKKKVVKKTAPKPCPKGKRMFKGKCYPIVRGSY